MNECVYFTSGPKATLKRGKQLLDHEKSDDDEGGGGEDDGGGGSGDQETEAQAVVVHVWPLIPDPLYLLL